MHFSGSCEEVITKHIGILHIRQEWVSSIKCYRKTLQVNLFLQNPFGKNKKNWDVYGLY
mgnify:CR=1 FL=1